MNVALSRVSAAGCPLGDPRWRGAWTNDERHPWTATRGRRIIPVLTWLTS